MPDKGLSFIIHVDGKELSEADNRNITHLTYTESLTNTSKFRFVLSDHDSFSFDLTNLKLRMPIRLYLGQKGSLVEVFDGEVGEIKPVFSKDTRPRIEITGLDRSYLMKRVPEPQIFKPDDYPNLATIVDYIINKHNLHVIISPVQRLLDYKLADDQSIQQVKKTDWAVLLEIARTGDYNLFCRYNIVYLVDDNYIDSNQNIVYTMVQRPTDHQIQSDKFITLLSFVPSLNSKGQRSTAQIIKYSYVDADGEAITEVNIDDLKSGKQIIYTDIVARTDTIETIRINKIVRDDAQAKTYVRAELERRARQLLKGVGIISGNPLIKIGDKHILSPKGLGKLGDIYSGEYRITEVTHTYTTAVGYLTKFKVERKGFDVYESI